MKHHLTLNFSKEAYTRLVEMQTKSGLSQKSDVIRQALRIYDYFLSQKRLGLQAALSKDNKLVAIVSLDPW